MSQIGPYTIEMLLGEGGMGQVFRAHDPRLGRAVAIKVVREEFTGRFEREAQAIAALNHPHVCTLYDVGPNFLAMEFVEGESLAERLARGKLSLERTLEYGAQVASALAAAHAKGIVHRDLKPANVMLAKSGVKVLDFGLARQTERAEAATGLTQTATGAVIGTPAYLAPELWRGAAADERSDLYAAGVLMYEMATGARPTPGHALPAGLPPRLRDLIERCLHPDPDERWQSAHDLQLELEWLARDLEGAGTSTASRARPVLTAAACAIAALAAAAVMMATRPPAPDPPVRITALLPPASTRFDFATTQGAPALSPDGRSLVFTAVGEDGDMRLWMRPLDSPTPVPLAGTEGARHPFWSPDSRWVGFYSSGFLRKIDTRGGEPISLTTVQGGGAGGSWGAKGHIVFTAGEFSPLQKIPAEGGKAELATATDLSGHGYPWFLPDGEHFLFASWPGAGRATLNLGSLGATTHTVIGHADSNAIYASGRLLYLRGNALVAQPFDLGSLRTTGEAAMVAEPVVRLGALLFKGMFTASQNGLIAYQKGADSVASQLTWFDREGKAVGTLGEPKAFFDMERSPDGKSLLATAPDAVGNYDLWSFDLERGTVKRFTSDPGGEYYGRWSADGRTVLFNSTRRGHYDLYRKPGDGSGREELVYADATDKVPTSLSRDGRHLIYFTGGGERYQLWRLELTSEPDARPAPERLLGSSFNEQWARFSPDDRWVAFETNESGQPEVYAAPVARPTEKQRISLNGGGYPRWRDAQTLVYSDRAGQLQEASLRITDDTVDVVATKPVFTLTNRRGGYGYELTPDGQRALIAVPIGQTAEPLTLVENWTALER